MRCQCGLDYVQGHPADEALHEKQHDDYLNGPRLADLAIVPRAPLIAGLNLVVVKPSMQKALRSSLAAAAMVGLHETPGGKAGYYGEATEAQEAMLLAVRGERAVGVVLTALDEPHWRMAWDPSGAPILVDPIPVTGPRWKVGRVWVASAFRRQGIARALLEAAAAAISTPLPEMGWELPLTPGGRIMLAHLIPGRWLARGDAFAMEQTLRPNGDTP